MFKKAIYYLLGYLFVLVIIPLLLLIKIQNEKFSLDIPGYLTLYVFVISPFLFIIPYKLAKLKNKKEKILFVLFGFIIPFAILYLYLYLEFQKSFNPNFL